MAVSSVGDVTMIILAAVALIIFGLAALFAVLRIPALLRAQRSTNRILALMALQRGVDKDEVLNAWETGT